MIDTQEENFRAYKLFSMMDVDGGGTISLRELKRVLMGDDDRYVTCDFTHPDTGIVWRLDEEDCVCIDSIEQDSSAMLFPFLITRMRIHRINRQKIHLYDPSQLQALYQILLQLGSTPVEIEFVEPIIIINKFSKMLDIQIENGEVFSIELPIGAVYSLNMFKQQLSSRMIAVNPVLKHIKVGFYDRKRQIFFKCRRFEFRLLFGTGPHYRTCCRYALGFNAADSHWDLYHEGQPLLIDLDLELNKIQIEILMGELFVKFDRSGSGEFEFEEFRDFYIKYFDSEESIRTLKEYAAHRFRDIELEKMQSKEALDRENKLKRRAYLKIRFHDTIEEQKRRFMQDSSVDKYGSRRRHYRHRSPFGSKPPLPPVKEANDCIDDDSASVQHRAPESTSVEGTDKKAVVVVTSSSTSAVPTEQQTGRRRKRRSAPPVEGLDQKKRIEDAKERRNRKDEQRKKRRQEIMRRIVEANKQLYQQSKADPKIFKHTVSSLYMAEAHYAVKKAVIKNLCANRSIREKGEELDLSETVIKELDLTNYVASPALRIEAGILQDKVVNLDDVQLIDMHSSKLHPAAQSYFLIRNHKKEQFEFNSQLKHPAYFLSDYERQPHRNAMHSSSVARYIQRCKRPGELYRAERGLKRVLSVPSYDVIPPKRTHTKQRVRFLEDWEPITPKTVVARTTVMSVRAFNLKRVSLLEINSPFVKLFCGNDWKFVTEVNSLGGSFSEWDDLNWMFRVYKQDSITVEVYSGSVSQSQLIGRYVVSSQDFVSIPVDNKKHNNMVLIADIMDDRKRATGSIELNLIVEKGKEWDWYVDQYQQEQQALKLRKDTIERFSSHFRGVDPDKIRFPLSITIITISVFDLKAVHLLVRNRPYVELSCGSVQEVTTVVDDRNADCSSSSVWNDVGWRVNLVSKRANLIFTACSNGVTIGRFAISGKDLIALHRNVESMVEVYGDLKSNNSFTGKISFICRVHLPASDDDDDDDDAVADLNPTNVNNSFLSASSTYSSNTNVVGHGFVQLPAEVNLLGIEIDDLPLSNMFLAMHAAPQVSLTCGDFSRVTAPFDKFVSGRKATWYGLKWSFPISDRLTIDLSVMNHSKVICGKVIRAKELLNFDKDINGRYVVEHELHDGKRLCGRVKLIISYRLEGSVYEVNKLFIDLANSVEKSKFRDETLPISADIDRYNQTIESILNDADPFDRKSSLFLQDSDALVDPRAAAASASSVVHHLKMIITDVVATDLKAVHFLVRNSPRVTIACDNVTLSTPIINRAGSSAIWTGLTTYHIDMLSTLSIIMVGAWSKDKGIGSQMVRLRDLCDCAPDGEGNRQILVSLVDSNSNISGKLKLNFILERPEIIAQSLINVKSVANIDPPILLTMFSISVVGARSVNRFAKNSLVVKALCSIGDEDDHKWQDSTFVQENIGQNAKWDDVGWSIIMLDQSVLKLTVQSETVFIGEMKIPIADVMSQSPNKQGVCELEGYLTDKVGRRADTGMIRVTYTYETTVLDDEETGSEDEEEEEERILEDLLDDPLARVKSLRDKRIIYSVEIDTISLDSLMSVHSLVSNSPYVKIRCDDNRCFTDVSASVATAAAVNDAIILRVISVLLLLFIDHHLRW